MIMTSWPVRIVAMLLSALAALPAFAEEKITPQAQSELAFSYAPVVKKAAPAVVNIYTSRKVQVTEGASQLARDPFFRQFFGQQFNFGGRTHEQVVSSLGSGVIVKPDGTIVTSHHVIKDAQEIRVVLADKREFDAKVILRDPESDLAFLKIDAPAPLPSLELRDSDSLEVGDRVLAIGNPFGVGQTVTNGIVSALARAARGVSDYQFFIQTDASINPGNSGGALVDMKARLIGINTAIYSSGGGSNGIGFAIPANMVRALLDGKVEGGRVVRPWLGIDVQPVTPEVAESLALPSSHGVLVKQLRPGSPAEEAGIRPGDVITAVNGADISSGQELQYRVALGHIGEEAHFTVMRSGKARTVDIRLTKPPATPAPDKRTLKGRQPLSGVTVANLSPALSVELGMGDASEGVVVLGTEGGLIGAALQPGDIIRKVNGNNVASTAQLEQAMQADSREWQIVYQRGDHLLTLTVQP
ncbi:MAG: Do family serine endopeptidase [Pseudomonadota bacterium]|nr:Do family serine endopeptidase [Pseudomonadota bacterium]